MSSAKDMINENLTNNTDTEYIRSTQDMINAFNDGFHRGLKYIKSNSKKIKVVIDKKKVI